ncbi:MAG TPA: hypothetical protein VKZ50_21030 [bacterium]|nr:hypothetical protein [bacterium]
MSVQKYRITIELEAVSQTDRCDITTAMVSNVIKDAVRLYGPDLLDAKVVSIMLDDHHPSATATPSASDPIHRDH